MIWIIFLWIIIYFITMKLFTQNDIHNNILASTWMNGYLYLFTTEPLFMIKGQRLPCRHGTQPLQRSAMVVESEGCGVNALTIKYGMENSKNTPWYPFKCVYCYTYSVCMFWEVYVLYCIHLVELKNFILLYSQPWSEIKHKPQYTKAVKSYIDTKCLNESIIEHQYVTMYKYMSQFYCVLLLKIKFVISDCMYDIVICHLIDRLMPE